jgi:hypothetical protein
MFGNELKRPERTTNDITTKNIRKTSGTNK